MARKVFFSFEYSDVFRAMVVRNSWVTQGHRAAGFIDAADFEAVKKKGDAAIKAWIDQQMHGTSVTVVLIGAHTCRSRFVQYEIEKSMERGNGLVQVDVSGIPDLKKETSYCCGSMLIYKPLYNWVSGNGYQNIGGWIEMAAQLAGR